MQDALARTTSSHRRDEYAPPGLSLAPPNNTFARPNKIVPTLTMVPFIFNHSNLGSRVFIKSSVIFVWGA